MDLQYKELESGVRLVKLKGKLDIHGVDVVEKRFAGYAVGERVVLLVDISEVSYIASIGIRLLLMTAKSLVGHGGRMAVLKPIPLVEEVLILSGIGQIVPIYADLEAASASLVSPI
jgi:anti-anti-sigma factor